MSEKMTGSCVECSSPCSRRCLRCRPCIQSRAKAKRRCDRCGGQRDRHYDGLCRSCFFATPRPDPYAPELVAKVRRLYFSGLSQTEIAAKFGVSQKLIYGLMRWHDIPRRPQVPRNQRGPRGHGYKPGSTNYKTLHSRVTAQRGRPSQCSLCGTDSAPRYEWANLTGNLADIYDYVGMCVPCHRRFDAQKRKVARVS